MKNKDFDFADINKFKLDWEAARQAKLVMDYGLMLADAEEEKDRAENKKEVTAAELDCDVRAEPEKYGLSKVSEPAVKRAIISDRRYQKAVDEEIKAKKAVNVLKAAMGALSNRKAMIETLVWLHNQTYNAEPKVDDMDMKDNIRRERVKEIRKLGQVKASN
jgi:hypothetical protein